MPKYIVKPENDMPTTVAGSAKGEKRYPTVYMPVSQEIVDALAVGDAVEVTLKGKVSALSSDKGSKQERHNLTVELREVEAYPDDAAEGADDAAEGEGQDGGKGGKKKKNSMKDEIDQGLGYQKG